MLGIGGKRTNSSKRSEFGHKELLKVKNQQLYESELEAKS